MSTKQTSPGQTVDITVISKPNSYIGLVGVDQSVLHLRPGYDLDKTKIFNELEEYSRHDKSTQGHDANSYEWHDFLVTFCCRGLPI